MRTIAQFFDELSYYFMQKEHRNDVSLTAPADPRVPAFHSLEEAFPKPITPKMIDQKVLWKRTRYEMHQLTFETPVFSEQKKNNVIPAVYFRQTGKPLGSVLVIHGYRVQNYAFFMGACKRFADWGYNAMMFELPFHLSRAPEKTFSGELILTGHAATTWRSMQQTVMEARGLIQFLRDDGLGYGSVGTFGVSLGGMLAGMMACLCPDLLFSIMTVPAGNIEQLFLKHRMGEMLRKDYPDWRLQWDFMKQVLPWITLTKLKPAIPKERILIQEAVYDRIVPSSVVEELWRSWGRPRRHIYPHGHLSVLFMEPSLWPDIKRFVNRLERQPVSEKHIELARFAPVINPQHHDVFGTNGTSLNGAAKPAKKRVKTA